MRLPILLAVFSCSLAWVLRADGPSDNLPDTVRRIPPPGIKISEADRAELEAGAADLGVGSRVIVPRLGGVGTVISEAVRDKVIVQVGALKLNVDVAELRVPLTPGPSARVERGAGRLDGRTEAVRALRPDGRLVAVELRDRREQLHGVHAGVSGSANRHVQPTVVYGVGSQPVPH